MSRLVAPAGPATSVELKVVVPEEAHAFTCAALGVDLDWAATRRVWFLDTPDLALERSGVVARLRQIGDGRDDSVIKLRPGRPVAAKRCTVEVDAMPGRLVRTTAIRKRLRHGMAESRRPWSAFFCRTQRILFASQAPAGLTIDDLVAHGPVGVRRIKVVPDGLDRRLTVERWTFPDGSWILELSTRCAAAEALEVAARTAEVLRAHRVEAIGPQETKTHATLAYFSR
ncbi:hypothetical protein FB565_007621 [Actinoplanes lutulentus]|uniref:hypothetical protein n=1 Tax=Actinoplanes lutulentus TaxID=1287878 RepID=UPI0017AD0DCB|nr:hypothetical protein [Actinoplanes lutulentus]MBB2947850.1 hypothetical protein [Actinoplanes lutulentus]